jgi:hypothetical protein
MLMCIATVDTVDLVTIIVDVELLGILHLVQMKLIELRRRAVQGRVVASHSQPSHNPLKGRSMQG